MPSPSDTPRTDALACTHDEASEWVERTSGYSELLDFARDLERELAEANASIVKLAQDYEEAEERVKVLEEALRIISNSGDTVFMRLQARAALA